MKYIEAPNNYEPREGEKVLFPAGGITGCGDWQSELVGMLGNKEVTILNPRRKHYPDTPEAAKEQIEWEHNHMKKANMVSFWFPNQTLCPITLYELGKISVGNQQLFIGIDPEYKRKLDVEIQTQLERPAVKIVCSLNELVNQIKEYIDHG